MKKWGRGDLAWDHTSACFVRRRDEQRGTLSGRPPSSACDHQPRALPPPEPRSPASLRDHGPSLPRARACEVGTWAADERHARSQTWQSDDPAPPLAFVGKNTYLRGRRTDRHSYRPTPSQHDMPSMRHCQPQGKEACRRRDASRHARKPKMTPHNRHECAAAEGGLSSSSTRRKSGAASSAFSYGRWAELPHAPHLRPPWCCGPFQVQCLSRCTPVRHPMPTLRSASETLLATLWLRRDAFPDLQVFGVNVDERALPTAWLNAQLVEAPGGRPGPRRSTRCNGRVGVEAICAARSRIEHCGSLQCHARRKAGRHPRGAAALSALRPDPCKIQVARLCANACRHLPKKARRICFGTLRWRDYGWACLCGDNLSL